MLKVNSPAIKRASGKVDQGRNHAAIGGQGKKGFVLSTGEFVNRTEAGKVAKKAGQAKAKILHSHHLKGK